MASNAVEQLQLAGEAAARQRWVFVKDMNGDGVFTISDISKWIEWIFFVPGDAAILALIHNFPETAIFLEISPSMLSGGLSGVMSACVWLLFCAIWNKVAS